MSAESALNFIVWALSHARPDVLPSGVLAVTADQCGTDPWECLLGTNGQKCTDQLLSERYFAVYSEMGWGALAFETITCDWSERGVHVCDGAGLLNAYRVNEQHIPSRLTPHGIYSRLGVDRGSICDTHRAYEYGEGVFQVNRFGIMQRVGWVCGVDILGEPLIIEAKGLAYSVCVERFQGRGWTHRARMNLDQNKEDTDER